MWGGALTVEAGRAFGMDERVVGAMAAIIVVAKDLKGLNVKKTIKNVDDLIEAAGKFKRGKTHTSENPIEGNADDVFKEITGGGKKLDSGAVEMKDGRVIHQHTAHSSGEKTITIDESGKRQKKVRFKTKEE